MWHILGSCVISPAGVGSLRFEVTLAYEASPTYPTFDSYITLQQRSWREIGFLFYLLSHPAFFAYNIPFWSLTPLTLKRTTFRKAVLTSLSLEKLSYFLITVVRDGSERTQTKLLDLRLTSVTQNYSSEFPDHYYEGPYRASGTPAYHRGSANSTFPHMPENLVCGFDNSYCAVMMTSNTRTLSTMSQTSQDSGYNSGFCSPIDSAPEFLHSPTSSPYVETWCDLAFDPVPSHPPLGPSNSSKKAEK